MQTLNSLRLEKAFRDFGLDMDNTDNPIEAGLGFAELDAPLTAEMVREGNWELDIAGGRNKATASLRPLLDPAMERVKC